MRFFRRLFHGRLNRRTFLVGFLLLTVIAGFIDYLLIDKNVLTSLWNAFPFNLILTIIVPILLIIYGFSYYIRRLHDIGHSGWLTLLLVIPIVNIILLILLLCQAGNKKANQYGKPPKALIDINALLGITMQSK